MDYSLTPHPCFFHRSSRVHSALVIPTSCLNFEILLRRERPRLSYSIPADTERDRPAYHARLRYINQCNLTIKVEISNLDTATFNTAHLCVSKLIKHRTFVHLSQCEWISSAHTIVPRLTGVITSNTFPYNHIWRLFKVHIRTNNRGSWSHGGNFADDVLLWIC